ncbi:hypothetical protein JAAARDRAFT_59568 [Jaapia argillacea MUCL 33604]|uniref:F-box domain-containing protein n=1 Tax=Jaapia argillacea MUCL 33604 TaxID=933084 RepID=A0A067Q0R1_9AGAM|nr:hypothetical protein JAAARDRAFT_59568 [Jaapia argillacea MUCL 33604]
MNTSVSLTRLPVELLDQIFRSTSQSAQHSLCTVSKTFNSISTRVLYEDIVLQSSQQIVSCCRTLAAKSSMAKHVKKLTCISDRDTSPRFHAYYNLLLSALTSITELRDLALALDEPSIRQILTICTWHRLLSFRCLRYPSSSPLHSFLSRHTSTLECLCISPGPDIPDPHSYRIEPITPILMPNLRIYLGPSEFAVSLIPGSKVSNASLLFDPPSNAAHVEEVVEALTKSGSEVWNVNFARSGWNLDLLELISVRLSGVRALGVHNVVAVGVVGDSTMKYYLQALETVLPRFKDLETVFVTCNPDIYDEENMAVLDSDFETARVWGGLCPRLSRITFPSTITWCRLQPTLWFPMGDDRRIAQWAVSKVVKREYPELIGVLERGGVEGEGLLARALALADVVGGDGEGEGDEEGGDEEEEVAEGDVDVGEGVEGDGEGGENVAMDEIELEANVAENDEIGSG